MSPYLVQRTSNGAAPIALGCMNFGKRTARADALKIVDRALDAGVGLLDTANVYNAGESERIVGDAVRKRRDGVLVATKVGAGRVGNQSEGLSPERVRLACDESLKRLKIDAIDLYYLHTPDPLTPPEATLEAIGGLLANGKIRHWGVSNYASWQILQLRHLASTAGLPAPVVAQQLYNALVRQLDVEYFKFTRAFPIHTTVYNPLAGGLLAGLHAPDGAAPKGGRFDGNPMYRRRYWHDALFLATEALRAVAIREGLTLVELAYAFVFQHPSVDSVLVGPGSLDHLDAALAARSITLTDDARNAIRDVYVELVGTDASYAR